MTETTDPKTGLPELPEGYSWWIGKYDIRILHEIEDTEWLERRWQRYDYTDLPNDEGDFGTLETRTRVEEEQETFLLLFKRTVTNKYNEYRYVNRFETIFSRETEFMTAEDRYGRKTLDTTAYEEAGPNTNQNILTRVHKLHKQFTDLAEAKALTGHYPPKTLLEVRRDNA